MALTKKDEDLKLYYSIGEVSELLGLSKSLIRFWDSEFEVLKPHKNAKGDRRFTKKNIEQLKLIKYLVKEKGFTLKGAKKEIRSNKSTLLKKNEMLEKLDELKDFLEELKTRL